MPKDVGYYKASPKAKEMLKMHFDSKMAKAMTPKKKKASKRDKKS